MGSPKTPHPRNYNGVKKMYGKGPIASDYSSIDFKDLDSGYVQNLPSSHETQNPVNEILKNRMLGVLLEAKRTADFNTPKFSSVDIYTTKDFEPECSVRSDTFFGGLIAKDQDIVISEDVLVNKSYDYQRFLVRKSLFEIKNNDFKIYSPAEVKHLLTNTLSIGLGLAGSYGLMTLGIASLSTVALPLVLGVVLGQYILAKRLQSRDYENSKQAILSLKGTIEKDKLIEDIKTQYSSFVGKVAPLFRSTCSIQDQLRIVNENL